MLNLGWAFEQAIFRIMKKGIQWCNCMCVCVCVCVWVCKNTVATHVRSSLGQTESVQSQGGDKRTIVLEEHHR